VTGLASLASTALQAQEHPPVSLVAAAREEIVEELLLTGTLNALQAAQLSPQVEGRVAAIEVDAGQRVGAGDTLLRLDDELARLELAQARASEREVMAELKDAERRLREVRELAKRKGVVAETEVRAREAEVERDRAILERRRAEVAQRAALLARHTLKAPFAGVIAQRLTDLGEWVDSDDHVMELVAVNVLRLDLQVPQGYFTRIGRQTPVSLRLEAFPTERVEAAITDVVPVSDPSARTFLARIRLANDQGRMTPGMSARATVRISTGAQGVVVPRDALIRYPDGRTVVWAVSSDGDAHKVSERQVKTGLAFSGKVEVVSGLDAGAAVVVRGNEALREGQQVRIEGGG
jgi:RND family efflux transporter MFP subunit